MPLKDGDIVRVFSIVSRFEDTVTLRGNVANPGRYPWKPGMRIRDLIPDAQALFTRRYWLDLAAMVNGRATEYPVRKQPSRPCGPFQQPNSPSTPGGAQNGATSNGTTSNGATSNGMAPNGNIALEAADQTGSYPFADTQPNAMDSSNELETPCIPNGQYPNNGTTVHHLRKATIKRRRATRSSHKCLWRMCFIRTAPKM